MPGPDPNQLPPLPIQGGSQPTPATPGAPVSGVMNFINALRNGLENVATHGGEGMQRRENEAKQKQSATAEATGIAEKVSSMGVAPDTAAFIAAGGDPNVAKMFSEYAQQTASTNAKYSSAIDAMPNIDDRTKGLMKMSLNNPQSAELVKGVMGNLMRQYVADQANVGREITAQGGIEKAKVAGQAGIKERQITAGATDRRTAEDERKYKAEDATKVAVANIAKAAKGGTDKSIAQAEKAAGTAFKSIIKPDSNGQPNIAGVQNYNNSVVQSLPFAKAVNNYAFTDADGNPIQQPGIVGAANNYFTDKKAAAGFLNTFNTDISKMSDPRAIASAVDAHLQEAVARGKIDPSNRDQMMKQLLAAVQLALQNEQQKAQEGVATGSAFVQPDDSNDQTEDEKKDNDPNTVDETNDND